MIKGKCIFICPHCDKPFESVYDSDFKGEYSCPSCKQRFCYIEGVGILMLYDKGKLKEFRKRVKPLNKGRSNKN